MSEPVFYTLVGLRNDGVSPSVDVAAAAGPADARVQAVRFLREHRSCTAVEIWSGGELLGVEHVEATEAA